MAAPRLRIVLPAEKVFCRLLFSSFKLCPSALAWLAKNEEQQVVIGAGTVAIYEICTGVGKSQLYYLAGICFLMKQYFGDFILCHFFVCGDVVNRVL